MSDIYLSLTETPSVVTLSQPVVAAQVGATVTVGNTVTVALDANSLSALENVTVTVGAAVSVSNFPASQTISGTVTANVFGQNANDAGVNVQIPVIAFDEEISSAGVPYVVPVQISNADGVIGSNNSLPISGTVTANLPALNYNTVKISFAEKSYYNGIYKKGTSGYVNTDGGGIPVYAPIDEKFHGGVNPVLTRSIQTGGGATFSGIRWNFQEEGDVQFYAATTATDLRLVTGWYDSSGEVSVSITPYSVEPVAITNSVTVGSLPAISGTVTVGAMPSGALTTRFGSVTTASVAQLTSAVTNTSRKYLLVQNIATSTVTIGIGFAPTTTQGIQLTAGAGLTFDAFTPTGAIYWLSSVTGSNFSILEG
jgi:hypothetical protein